MASELKKVDDLIIEIKSKIELNFSKNECSHDSIVESFRDLNNIIEELLETNPDYYYYYKYQYHMKYSSYLHLTGKTDLAIRHENFSKKNEESYKKTCANINRQSEINNTESLLDNHSTNNIEDDLCYGDDIFSKIRFK